MGEHSNVVLIWLMFLAASVCSQQCGKISKKEEDFVARFDQLFANDYGNIKPNATGGPLLVEVYAHFSKLDGVSAKDESYNADVFIGMRWKDMRLCHNETEDIIFSGEHNKPIWTPDVYIENALKTEKHEITKLNKFLRISPNGNILFSTRAGVIAKCTQDLMYFPLDSQNCKMVLESYGYPTKQMILKWMKRKAVVIPQREIPQFIISEPKAEETTVKYGSGIYSRLIVHVRLERRFGFYIIQAYMPCILVVMLSWLSFWINPEDIGDRIALGITCVLTLVFLMESINSSLPKVSYAKAIDFYIIGCFLYVFIVVLETVIAKHFSKVMKRFQSDSDEEDKDSSIIPNTHLSIVEKSWDAIRLGFEMKSIKKKTQNENDIKSEEETTVKKPGKKWNIDSYCRVIFPLLFLILNVCYWILCSNNGLKTGDH